MTSEERKKTVWQVDISVEYSFSRGFAISGRLRRRRRRRRRERALVEKKIKKARYFFFFIY